MIFSDISNELFDYRIYLIKFNSLFNISRIIRIHNKLVLDLRDNYSQKILDILINTLKLYRNKVKEIDLLKYNKLISKHGKLVNRLIKIKNKYYLKLM